MQVLGSQGAERRREARCATGPSPIMLPSPAARAGPMMRDRRDGEECSAAAALRDGVDDAEVEESRRCSSASKTHATG